MIHVWLGENSVRLMTEEADDKAPRETGGLLAGYWTQDRNEVVITTLVGPGPKAKHGNFTYRPDYDYQREEMRNIFDSSKGDVTYLGDWHTHPGGRARLSILDHLVLWRIARRKEAFAPQPLMLVWSGPNPWTPKIWIRCSAKGWPGDDSVQETKIIFFDENIISK